MAETVKEFVEDFSIKMETPYQSETRPSIYYPASHNAPFDGPVTHLYYYYVTILPDGRLEVRHYMYMKPKDSQGKRVSIDKLEVENIVTALTANARGSNDTPRPLPDRNFNNVSWRHRCHIAILFDVPFWTLFDKNSPNPPVIFLNRTKAGKIGQPNWAFFDAADLTIPIDGGPETRTAIAFINHYKSNDLGDEIMIGDHQYFWFNIYVNIAFTNPGDPKMVVIFDPGGTNDGPPVDNP